MKVPSPRKIGAWNLLPLVGIVIVLGGCKDVASFGTGPGEAYVGTVFGVEEAPKSFIRRGFPRDTRMRMTFRPEDREPVVVEPGGLEVQSPGRLTTDDGRCGLSPTFDGTPLVPIVALPHDQLSLYDFPGSGRLRNFIFLARPDSGALGGREAKVFVSLIRDGKIEVRVIAGPGRDCARDACARLRSGECDFFGVFALKKTQEPR